MGRVENYHFKNYYIIFFIGVAGAGDFTMENYNSSLIDAKLYENSYIIADEYIYYIKNINVYNRTFL